MRNGRKAAFLLSLSDVSCPPMPRWRNWYTRMLEVHMPQGLEVRVLSWAQQTNELDAKASGDFVCSSREFVSLYPRILVSCTYGPRSAQNIRPSL